MKRKSKGSLTIFAALSIMLVAAVLFTVLEAARMKTMHLMAHMNTESVMESLFASYNNPLWDKYHLLGAEASGANQTFSLINQEQLVEEISENNLDPSAGLLSYNSWNLYRMELADLSYRDYVLITDGDGLAYEKMVASYMQKNLVYEVAKKLYNEYQAVQELDKSSGDAKQQVDAAKTSIEQPGASTCNARCSVSSNLGELQEVTENPKVNENQEMSESSAPMISNPLDEISTYMNMGILSLLVENESELSDKKIDANDVVSGRELEKGTMEVTGEADWYDQVLLDFYLTQYYTNYLKPAEDQALAYELEYIVCGKDSDVENLKIVCSWLLGIREAANLGYIVTDTAKCEEAMALATALAGASLNPAVVECVKYGILAAWAFAESVLDVRALLQGDHIALVKNSEQWTSGLTGMLSSLGSFGKAKDCEGGLTYSEYLMFLMLANSASKVSYRSMDLQESYVRSKEGYENFQMDHVLIELSADLVYKWDSIFLGLVSIGDVDKTEFTYIDSGTYSYVKAGV